MTAHSSQDPQSHAEAPGEGIDGELGREIDGELGGATLRAVTELLAAAEASDDPLDLGPQWTRVKQSTVRTVDRGVLDLDDGRRVDVHLKRYRPGRFTDRARDGVRGHRAKVEFEHLRTAIQRGLPCVEPLVARALPDGRSVLVTRTASGQPLPDDSWERGAATRAGNLLRRCHDAGLVAHDLHPGNLIDDGQSTRLVDLTSVRFSEDPLATKQRAQGLAFFCRALDGGVLDPRARALLAAYGPTDQVRAAADRIGQRLRARGLLAFGRRAFRPCRHTTVERAKRRPRTFLYRPAAELHAAARELIANPGAAATLKSGRRGEVANTTDLVLKTRTAAAARRLFEAAYWLEFAGVPHAGPVLLQTFDGRGAVVSRLVPGSTLTELAQRDEVAWTPLAQSLGHAVGRLHAHGLRNRDLKLDNLIAASDSNQVVMVDLDGIRRRGRGETRGRAHDLGRLLAAWRHGGGPGGESAQRTFARAYARALATLRQRTTPARLRTVFRMAERRANAWASAHRD